MLPPDGTPIYAHTRLAMFLDETVWTLDEILADYEGVTALPPEIEHRLRAICEEMAAIMQALELPPAANDPERRRLDIAPPGL